MGFPCLRAKLEAFQGSDFAFGPVYFGDQDPDTTDPADITGINLTGAIAHMQVRPSQSALGEVILDLTSNVSTGSRIEFSSGSAGGPVPAYPNGYAIYVTADDTLAMGNSEASVYGNDGALTYYYDLFLTFVGDPSTRLIWQSGSFQLTPTVTRESP